MEELDISKAGVMVGEPLVVVVVAAELLLLGEDAKYTPITTEATMNGMTPIAIALDVTVKFIVLFFPSLPDLGRG